MVKWYQAAVPAKKLAFVLNTGIEILDQHHECNLSQSCVVSKNNDPKCLGPLIMFLRTE